MCACAPTVRCAETASLASLISLPSALFPGRLPFRLYMRYCMDTAPNENKKEKRCKLKAKQCKPFIRESCALCTDVLMHSPLELNQVHATFMMHSPYDDYLTFDL